MIVGAVLFCEFVLYIILNRNDKRKWKHAKKVILYVFYLVVIGVIVFVFNWGKIQTLPVIQSLGRGGGIFHNIRFEMQRNVLQQLLENPFGGYHAELYGLQYCHNVWLDVANASGVIPFILLVSYTFFSIYELVILLKNNKVEQKWKYVLSGLYLSFFLYYMVEPALMADVKFFVPWTYINGIIYSCNRDDGKSNIVEK